MSNEALIANIKSHAKQVFENLTTDELIEKALERNEGQITDKGALAADTGEFTGRSPKDKFLVKDAKTADTAWWGTVNQPFESEKFDALLNRVVAHLEGREIFVRHAYACADPTYRLNIQVVTESAYQNLFAKNLFLRPTATEIATQPSEWVIIAAPSFIADPAIDGTRQHNFTIVDLTK